MIPLLIAGIIGAIGTFAATAEPNYTQMYEVGVDKSYPLYVDVDHKQFIGTAFVVEGKSGKKFMMTAGHVCDAADAEKMPLFTKLGKSNVIFMGWNSLNVHDICILGQVSQNLPAHKMGSEPEVADKLWGLGFPSGYPFTVMSGNVIGDVHVQITTDRSPENCTGIYKIVAQTFMGIPMGQGCAISGKETAVTMSVAPGASGSPVVDRYGRLVGIISAQNNSTANWLLMVPHRFLEKVIDKL